MKTCYRLSLLLMTSALAMPIPIHKAHAAAPAAPANRGGIEEVVVTARKRRESILKTPVVETVIGNRQLQRYATLNVKTAVAQVPDIVIGQALGAFGSQISLRGVGTSTLNPSIDQSASLVLDGLQVTQGVAYQSALFDVSRVEVLKGPQALFFGKSSTAGVISLRSNDPSNKFEVIARSGYEFNAKQRQGDLIVSGPVTDTLGLRLATSVGGENGFFNNVATGIPATGSLTPRIKTLTEQNDYIVRGTALWKPWTELESRLKFTFDHSESNGDAGGGPEVTSCPGGTNNTTGFLPGVNFLTGPCGVSKDVKQVDMNPADFPGIRNAGTPFNRYDQLYGTWENNYRPIPSLTITSVSGYYALHDSFLINGTDTQEAGPPLVADDNFYRRDATQELRATTDFAFPINFTAGAFIEDGHMISNVNLRGNAAYGLPAILGASQGSHFINIDSQSVFGQAIWKIIPKLELAGGLRWTHEDRTDQEDCYAAACDGVRQDLAVPRIASSHINPEASLTYTPTNDLTLFASFKTASKSGSFQTDQIITPIEEVVNGKSTLVPQNNSFNDETVRGGEIGIKGYLFNRRFRYNFDAYHYIYSSLQVGANVVTNGVITDITQNAGSAKVQGIEFDGVYQVPFVEELTLHGSGGLNQARYQTFNNAPCTGGQTIAAGCNTVFNPATKSYNGQNLGGRPLVRAPNFTANFGFDYSHPIPFGWTASLSSDTNFSSNYYTDLTDAANTIQKAYFKTNMNITFTSPNKRWDISFVGNDLNNALTYGNCINGPFRDGVIFAGNQGTGTNGPSIPDAVACYVEPGRELWLRATYHFTG